MHLLSNIELLQIQHKQASSVAIKAIDFLGQLSLKCGAKVYVNPDFTHQNNGFNSRGKITLPENNDPLTWASKQPNRIILIANTENGFKELLQAENIPIVEINIETWQSEATLFTQSGLAKLFGNPEEAPLIPVGNYASGTIAYAAFAALTSVYGKLKRFGKTEIARVNGLAALAWVNWKSVAAGQLGQTLNREGKAAEWPALPCKDGYTAFVFVELLWKAIVTMVGDNRLRDEKLATFEGRKKHRDLYMNIIRNWALSKTKTELRQEFFKYNIPGAPVITLSEILKDPLFLHRDAFQTISKEGKKIQSPVIPHRIVATTPSHQISSFKENTQLNNTELPLAGIRILDFGLITAGAGSSAVLADMGAEVLKIESETYADPFRKWMGSNDSPLFKFNNRNKYGVGIDLKTKEGKAQFIELVKNADVVLENFRRGVLDKMGFSFEELKKYNPNIVLASISGQGLDGPMVTGMTFGSTLEANAGMAAQTCDAEGTPFVSGRNLNFPRSNCMYVCQCSDCFGDSKK